MTSSECSTQTDVMNVVVKGMLHRKNCLTVLDCKS